MMNGVISDFVVRKGLFVTQNKMFSLVRSREMSRLTI